MSESVAARCTEAQLAAVAKLACGCQRGGGICLLCGPSGIGKTTVLVELAAAVGPGRSVGRAAAAAWSEAPALPDVVLADDAHLADASALAVLWDRCRQRQSPASLVLAGEGRLLTLVSRDIRLAHAVRLRVALPVFTAAETHALVDATLAAVAGGPVAVAAVVAHAVHEIAGGSPAAAVQLAELAAVMACARPDKTLVARDVEVAHARLSPAAA